LYGLALVPAPALSPSVAGFGPLNGGRGVEVAVGVGVGLPIGVGVGVGVAVGGTTIGGGFMYWLGQMDGIIPADGGVARLMTPIILLYRMLLGSPLANIGLCASAPVTSLQRLGEPELTIVGFAPLAYWLKLVARHKFVGLNGFV